MKIITITDSGGEISLYMPESQDESLGLAEAALVHDAAVYVDEDGATWLISDDWGSPDFEEIRNCMMIESHEIKPGEYLNNIM